jgi:hypothetical protein
LPAEFRSPSLPPPPLLQKEEGGVGRQEWQSDHPPRERCAPAPATSQPATPPLAAPVTPQAAALVPPVPPVTVSCSTEQVRPPGTAHDGNLPPPARRRRTFEEGEPDSGEADSETRSGVMAWAEQGGVGGRRGEGTRKGDWLGGAGC